jgi:hypothetical protein
LERVGAKIGRWILFSYVSKMICKNDVRFPLNSAGNNGWLPKHIMIFLLRNIRSSWPFCSEFILKTCTFGARIAQSVYRLATGWTVGGSNPGRGRDFSHTSRPALGAHPASCTMGTGSFPGVKRPVRGADHPPLLAQRSRECRAIPLPLCAFESVTGYLYLYMDFGSFSPQCVRHPHYPLAVSRSMWLFFLKCDIINSKFYQNFRLYRYIYIYI